ncbi:MAG TPA: winged helix-turn-helix domain-containing protein [Bryobacteraceae bacterium]|nr:winged helix-turn-helix domain-containing protein [Bryobacteraceae bacterium]
MVPGTKGMYEFGPYRLDATRRTLSRGEEPLALTSKVFDTLLALVTNRHRVLLKDELMKLVWPDSFVEEVNLAQNVSALRKILGESPGQNRYIATIPGKGYRFVGEVREDAAPSLPQPARRRSRAPFIAICLFAALAASVYIVGIAGKRTATFSGPRSLAVLPFRSLDKQNSDDHLGLGMTDAVITKLTNVRALVVRPTSAVLRYADGATDPAKAGHELAVESLLDGKVQKSGDRIRVTVQLVRVEDGRPLWAQTFDDKFTDIFSMEDSISEQVAHALAVKFGGEEQKELARHYTDNIEAYRDYVQGRYFEFQFTPGGLNQALREFDRAIELDPSYALAYAGLADAYTTASDWVLPPREALPKAESAARKALVFDDQLAEAHAALAHALLHEWKLQASGQEFRRALSLNPNNTSFYFAYSEYLADTGREDDAIAELNKALQLDPLSPEINGMLLWPMYLKRDYDGALAACEKTIKLYPDNWMAHWWGGFAYLMKHQFPLAFAELSKARTLNPDSTGAISSLAAAYALSGNRSQAEKLLTELMSRRSKQYVSPMDIAGIHHALGEKDEMFRWLNKAFDDEAEMLIVLQYDPQWDDLRSDPRFQELVRRVHRDTSAEKI